MALEDALFDQKGRRKYLNANERQRFYESARKFDDPLRRAFLLMLYYTGARISEVLSLEWTSLDAEEKLIVLRTLKQRGKNRIRAVPVPSELIEPLQESTCPQDRIWSFCRTTGWKLVKNCMFDAGIEGIRACPKGLRHGFAVECVRRGVPVSMVKKWMGHTRLESTTVYLDLVGEDERELARRLWMAD